MGKFPLTIFQFPAFLGIGSLFFADFWHEDAKWQCLNVTEPNFRKIIFFENRAPSHFGHCHFASLRQKSEKTNEPIPRKAGNRQTNELTNERTNEHRLIYRTSEVGPKSNGARFSQKKIFGKFGPKTA